MALFATRLRDYRLTLVTLFLLLPLAATSALAQTQITNCGTFITAPGEYVLAKDLTGCQYGVIIGVGAHDVVLSLAGHRITGSATPNTGAGIKTQSGATRIRIQGPGVISNFEGSNSGGVLLYSSGAQEVTAVTCTQNNWGFVYGQGTTRIHGNVATNNVDGFFLLSAGLGAVEVSDNLASGNREDGIVTSSSQGEVRITHNTVVFNGRYGISAEKGSGGLEILSNTALGNGTFDLSDGNRVCQNTWADNTFGTASGPCTH
jgi:parallel beta-helix repeat protein